MKDKIFQQYLVISTITIWFPFFRYAVSQVLYHANASAQSISQTAFLREFDWRSWLTFQNLFQDHPHKKFNPNVRKDYVFAANNWAELLKAELGSGQCSDSNDHYYRHPLIVASDFRHETCVRALLATEGIDIQTKDLGGKTALWWATSHKRRGVIDHLLGFPDIDTSVTTNLGRTLLWVAHQKQDTVTMERLIAVDHRPSNSVLRFEGTTICRTVSLGFDVELLLSAGDSMVGVVNRVLVTPLQAAMNADAPDTVWFILRQPGVNMDDKALDERTPLLFAASKGNVEVVEYLLSVAGVDINQKDNSGETPFSLAANNGHSTVVALLLARRYGKNTSILGRHGWSCGDGDCSRS
jgi:ankyrin repeat protein